MELILILFAVPVAFCIMAGVVYVFWQPYFDKNNTPKLKKFFLFSNIGAIFVAADIFLGLHGVLSYLLYLLGVVFLLLGLVARFKQM